MVIRDARDKTRAEDKWWIRFPKRLCCVTCNDVIKSYPYVLWQPNSGGCHARFICFQCARWWGPDGGIVRDILELHRIEERQRIMRMAEQPAVLN